MRGRAAATLAVAMSAVAAGGALAHDPAPPSRGADAPAGARSGASVEAIQRALGLKADGVYGRRTRAAVRRFQRSRDLTADGVAGRKTLAALGLSGSPSTSPSTSSPSRPSAAREDVAAGVDAAAGTAGTEGEAASASTATLAKIAQCESGGNATAVSADGQYRGKYQFSRETWRRLGGTGDPAEASEAEQDRLAAKLLAQEGTSPWPVCGA